MRKLICLIVLAAFVSATCGEARAQTPAAVPQKQEIIELGETWPDTPAFSALRTGLENQWVQRGQYWFTGEGSGALRQIRNLSCTLSPQMGKTVPSTGSDWQGSVFFQWKEERYYIPKRGKWTPWRGGGFLLFGVTIENGKTTAQTKKIYTAGPSSFKRSDTVRPEVGEIEAALVKPEMTAEESNNLPFSSRPRLLSMGRPEYSPEGRAKKINGTVILAVEVLADGSIGRVSVIRSLGFGLDEKAVGTIRKGKFVPATALGEPVTANVKVAIHFNIH